MKTKISSNSIHIKDIHMNRLANFFLKNMLGKYIIPVDVTDILSIEKALIVMKIDKYEFDNKQSSYVYSHRQWLYAEVALSRLYNYIHRTFNDYARATNRRRNRIIRKNIHNSQKNNHSVMHNNPDDHGCFSKYDYIETTNPSLLRPTR